MDKIIFFDIDGTLLRTDTHTYPESTILALHKLRENGFKLCIASGRAYDSLLNSKVHEIFDFDAYICNSGQLILDRNLHTVYEKYFDESTILKTIARAKEINKTITLKCSPRIRIGEEDEYTKEAEKFFKKPIPPAGEYHGEKVGAMLFYGPVGWDYAPYLDIEGIHVMPGISAYADVAIRGVSKYTAIQFILDHYHMKEYISFGDSDNDLEMFKYCSYSICMGQGTKNAKDASDYITTSIEDDGIYNACKNLGYFG